MPRREKPLQHVFILHFMDGEKPDRDVMKAWLKEHVGGHSVKWKRDPERWGLLRYSYLRVAIARWRDAFAFKMRWSLDLARPAPDTGTLMQTIVQNAQRYIGMYPSIMSTQMIGRGLRQPTGTGKTSVATIADSIIHIAQGERRDPTTHAFKVLKNREYGAVRPEMSFEPRLISTEEEMVATYGAPRDPLTEYCMNDVQMTQAIYPK